MNANILAPHLFEGEYELLHRELSRASSYLEFGSGGSTALAVELGIRRIVSVDTDPAWLRRTKESIGERLRDRPIELIHCDIGPVEEWGRPIGRDKIENWPQYFIEPWRRFHASNATPDLIYIDGRFRVACALFSLFNLNARRRLFRTRSRILVHDFLGRPEYEPILRYCSVVESCKTLILAEPRRDIRVDRLLADLLLFQFDIR